MEKPEILAQTADYAVIFKPAGLPCQLKSAFSGYTLESELKLKLGKNKIFFPHRLDKITSGLLIVAFDKDTVEFFNNEIRNKRLGKYYLALTESKINDPHTLIGLQKRYIKVHDDNSEIVRSGGLPSFLEILSVEPAPGNNECFHVLIRLLTGRMHQIRVMLADMGIPLCGDRLYNPGSKYKEFYLESIVLKFTDPENIEQRFYYKNPKRIIEISETIKAFLNTL
ncbi:MAG TPA: RNA pseudouridine synthase [Clostridiales bacterium]|nr:RNA pseudouridine synthase [Clostridiales bacterium]HQP68820.1 RNA pseudouridine synthase [Clostridiales bacterium]